MLTPSNMQATESYQVVSFASQVFLELDRIPILAAFNVQVYNAFYFVGQTVNFGCNHALRSEARFRRTTVQGI